MDEEVEDDEANREDEEQAQEEIGDSMGKDLEDTPHLVKGMTVLQLAEEHSAPSPENPALDPISHAGTLSSTKRRSAVKAASGWAI